MPIVLSLTSPMLPILVLNIRDQDELEAFEVEISTLRADEPLPEGNFDPACPTNLI